MRCYVCGRVLVRAAATVDTAYGTSYAGPTCARARGLLPPTVSRPRMFTARSRRRPATSQQDWVTP